MSIVQLGKLCRLHKRFDYVVMLNNKLYFSTNKTKLSKEQIIEKWRKEHPREEVQKEFEIVVPIDHLKFSYGTSGGPGGQNVNKVHTKVELRCELDSDQTKNWLPATIQSRLLLHYKNRINKNNEFVILSDTHRTQHENRLEVIAKFQEMIDKCCFGERKRITTDVPTEYKEQIKNKKRLEKYRKQKNQHRYD
ncbi:hypothetical protein RFI_02378 [Reticulomyxa filosa]|uniref:Prokaryotic-type class I peptide chain release factors domain-containing protein n=1 Tax=Reticulomyxa filosa TaxID=46433 RepID=X6P9B6_RETFI|nr:hypothetical protein RFI_02378 [Reticulomyxa filosa]|eukprot:ETO34708.1 hypothetical protein RFI_02378 [Reticulomyxa filosa]